MTILLNAAVDASAAKDYLGAARVQLTKRIGFALNTTANDMQKAIQDSLGGKFHLRRATFVKRTIYRDRQQDFPDIKAGKLVAAVRINPDRDFIAKFEEGGRKRPDGTALAVPIVRATERPNLVITRANRYNLANLPARLLHGGGSGTKFYGLVSRKGVPLILEKVSKLKRRVVWAFLPSVPIPKKLSFHDLGTRTFEAKWPVNVIRELDEAIRRAEQKRTD